MPEMFEKDEIYDKVWVGDENFLLKFTAIALTRREIMQRDVEVIQFLSILRFLYFAFSFNN